MNQFKPQGVSLFPLSPLPDAEYEIHAMAIFLRLNSIINAWQSIALPGNEYDSPTWVMVMSRFKIGLEKRHAGFCLMAARRRLMDDAQVILLFCPTVVARCSIKK